MMMMMIIIMIKKLTRKIIRMFFFYASNYCSIYKRRKHIHFYTEIIIEIIEIYCLFNLNEFKKYRFI